MQQFLVIGEIKERAEAMNLSLKRLAQDAGVDPVTCYRAVRGKADTRAGNLVKLTSTLLDKERRLLRHLIDLHGTPQTGSASEQFSHPHQEASDATR